MFDRTILRDEWREVVQQEVFLSMAEYYEELKKFVEEGLDEMGEEIFWNSAETDTCLPPLKKPVVVPKGMMYEDVSWVEELVDWLEDNVHPYDSNFALKLLSVYNLSTISPAPEMHVEAFDDSSLLMRLQPFDNSSCWPDELMADYGSVR